LFYITYIISDELLKFTTTAILSYIRKSH